MKINERNYSDKTRIRYAEEGMALPDGSFPISNKKDLENAIKSYGLAKNKDNAKKFIIKRAKDLNALDMIPSEWKTKNNQNEKLYKKFTDFMNEKYSNVKVNEDFNSEFDETFTFEEKFKGTGNVYVSNYKSLNTDPKKYDIDIDDVDITVKYELKMDFKKAGIESFYVNILDVRG